MAVSPGQQFDRYSIEELVGEGGMGRVYRAFDTRLERRVALKVLHPLGGDEGESVATALREARAAAAIAHPNATAVYDAHEIDGTSFIAMEFVAGTSLRTLIGGPPIPLATRLRWLIDVAAALAAAHRMGVVHRDVKPENVMVRHDGLVKVLDFGVARRTVIEAPDSAGGAFGPRPSVGYPSGARIAGTPAYMAPEQIRGEDIDGRADQFGWGVLAYELLTGRLPWKTAKDVVGFIAAVVSEQPEAPSTVVSAIPRAIDLALLRALSKDPAHRFPTMLAAASELAPFARTSLVMAAIEPQPPAHDGGATSPPSMPPDTEPTFDALGLTVALVAETELGEEDAAALADLSDDKGFDKGIDKGISPAPPPAITSLRAASPLRSAVPSGDPPKPLSSSPGQSGPAQPAPISRPLPEWTTPSSRQPPLTPPRSPRDTAPTSSARVPFSSSDAGARARPAPPRLRRPFGPGFHEPDFESPVDLEGHLAMLPADATSKGMFCLDVLQKAALVTTERDIFRVAQLPERRYVPFRDYPLAENLRLTVAAARALYPRYSLGEGLRRIGQTTFEAVLATHIGRALFGILGRDVEPILLTGPKAFKLMINLGQMTAEKSSFRTFTFRAQGFPVFLETFQVGVLEGVLRHCGERGRIRIALEDLGTASIELRLL
jgi:eukaryotic-like serine/threonine-protein kinase